jgi:hypothetical protein
MKCAWCKTELPGLADSHGICKECADEIRKEIGSIKEDKNIDE